MRLQDDLPGSLRTCLEAFPDGRRGANRQYSVADFGMSAFSVFFMQSPSFLAHQRRLEEGHGRSNCQSLFGMGKLPSDNRIRDMLDPAPPELLNPVFFELMPRLEREKGGLDVFRRLEGHVPIAGSERLPLTINVRSWHRIFLLQGNQLPELLVTAARYGGNGILSCYAGGNTGCTGAR